MGISLRIFIVNDDDTIKRFALARYLRLHRHDPDECLPQYAGKRVRFALVAVDLVDRNPVEIIRTQYFWTSFDSNGKIDPVEREKKVMLVMDSLDPVLEKQESGKVVDARHRFARQRFESEYLWKPSDETENALVDAVFGKEKQ